MLPPVRPVVPIGLVRQLVDVEVNVPVEPDVCRIGPDDPRVPDVRFRLQRRGIVNVDGVLLRHEHVHGAVAVGAEAVCVAAALTQVHHVVGRALRAQDVERWIRAEVARFDAVEVVARQRGVVHDVAVEGEFGAVEALGYVGQGQTRAALVKGYPLVRGHVVEGAERGRVPVQLAPGFARAEVQHDEARAAFVAAVDDVGYPLARCGGVGAHVEAEVVHVRVWVVDARRERVGSADGVVGQVDGYEFGPPGGCVRHRERFRFVRARSSRVEDPEGVVRGDEKGLHADEGVCRVATERDPIE